MRITGIQINVAKYVQRRKKRTGKTLTQFIKTKTTIKSK